MKNEHEQKRKVIDRVLDGEIDTEQRAAFTRLIRSDAALNRNYEDTVRALHAIKTGERISAPPFFTREVMRRLPRRKPGLMERFRDFMLKGRVLRWNMATAFGTAVIVVLALTLAIRGEKTPGVAVQDPDGNVMVTMNLYAPDAHKVAVAGTFNKWQVDANVLRKAENGFWTVSIPLQPGDYTYMFIVDGKAWVTDPNAGYYRDDGFGNKNAVLRVKT